jgi:hypothetical protein
MKYAVVLTDTVVCVADWDGQTQWEPPFGGTAVPLHPNETCEAGWSFDPNQDPRFRRPPESDQQ